MSRVAQAQPLSGSVQPLFRAGETVVHGCLEGEGGLIDPQKQAIEWSGQGMQPMLDQGQAMPAHVQVAVHEPQQAVAAQIESAPQFDGVGRQQFGCPARSGRAEIGGEIGDGEIDLMAHGADHWADRGANGPGQGFVVEGLEVLDRAAAPAENNGVGGRQVGVDGRQRLDYFSGGLVALHRNGIDGEVERGQAAPGDAEEIVHRCPVGRGDQGEMLRNAGQGAFAVLVEESLGREPPLQCLEGLLQRPSSLNLDSIDDQLVFAPRFVYRDAPPANHMRAVLERSGEVALLQAEEHRLDLAGRVLEGEVEMARGWSVQVGNFAGDADKGKAALDQGADGGVELADGEWAAVIHGGGWLGGMMGWSPWPGSDWGGEWFFPWNGRFEGCFFCRSRYNPARVPAWPARLNRSDSYQPGPCGRNCLSPNKAVEQTRLLTRGECAVMAEPPNTFNPDDIRLQPLGPPPGLLEQFNLPPKVIAFVRRNQRMIWVAVVACAMVSVAVSGYTTYRDHRAAKAASALDAALMAKTDLRQRLEQVGRDFAATPSALWANIELAQMDEKEQQPGKALARYEQINTGLSAKSPLKPLLLFKIATLLEREKQFDKALATHGQLAGFAHFAAEAHRAMGRINEAQGNKDQAAAMYAKYLELTAVPPEQGRQAPPDPERELVQFRLNQLKK